MGDLYWSSLANSFMDYDWCNLLKCNRFQRGVTVLWPKCYTLEVKLGAIDTVYNTNTVRMPYDNDNDRMPYDNDND